MAVNESNFNPMVVTDVTNVSNGKKAQGFTMNTNTGKLFSARLNTNDSVRLTRITRDGAIDKYSETLAIGHANDCAYYNGRIFIAPEKSDGGKKIIYSFATDFTDKREHRYEKASDDAKYGDTNYPTVNSIAYIPGSYGWFVLGTGTRFVCAYFDGNTFKGMSSFDLPSHGTRDGCVHVSGQGICVSNGALYKVYSQHTVRDAIIVKNDIVSYALTGTFPSYSGATKKSKYTLDSNLLHFFEAEGIAEYDGARYVSVTAQESNGAAYKNFIYKIPF